jgi:hypothetical protein
MEMEDHDLLVRLDVLLDRVTLSLDETRLSVAAKMDSASAEPRFSRLETGVAAKADTAQVDARFTKFEATVDTRAGKSDTRIESLQLKVYVLVGALSTLNIALDIVLHLLK